MLQVLSKKNGIKIEPVSSADFSTKAEEILSNMSRQKIVVISGIKDFDDESLLRGFRLYRSKRETVDFGGASGAVAIFIGSKDATVEFRTVNHPLLNCVSFINRRRVR